MSVSARRSWNTNIQGMFHMKYHLVGFSIESLSVNHNRHKGSVSMKGNVGNGKNCHFTFNKKNRQNDKTNKEGKKDDAQIVSQCSFFSNMKRRTLLLHDQAVNLLLFSIVLYRKQTVDGHKFPFRLEFKRISLLLIASSCHLT